MDEPSERNSRLALAGGLAVALVVGGAGILIGRATVKQAEPAAQEQPAPTLPPPEPTPAGPLGRAELLTLAASAADAASAGSAVPDAVIASAGRRFVLYLPFGCKQDGQTHPDATISWSYDDQRRVLKLRTTLSRWLPADWWPATSAPADTVAISGLWVGHPWSTAERCPPVTAASPPEETATPESATGTAAGAATDIASATSSTSAATAEKDRSTKSPAIAATTNRLKAAIAKVTPQTPELPPEPSAAPTPPPLLAPERTLAIGQLLTATSPRSLLRDGKPLEADIRMPSGFAMPASGLRLRLAGRIDPQRSDGPIRCIQPEGWRQRPICLIIATIEEAVIENPDTGARLISWPIGG